MLFFCSHSHAFSAVLFGKMELIVCEVHFSLKRGVFIEIDCNVCQIHFKHLLPFFIYLFFFLKKKAK